tara:strand:+ start:1132 stop:1953 length:822 start_codon:yes stop_codon:yes gene_type:complete
LKTSFSVILSTYNSEAWLEKVVFGFQYQTFKNFEIIIADDGSGLSTKKLISNLKKVVFFPIFHVWHPDNGFQKTTILNKALLKSRGDYIVFTDGDCIPRSDFLEIHNKHKKLGYFLSGGYFKLPMDISKIIKPYDIESQNCFSLKWLNKLGLPFSYKNLKLNSNKLISSLLNFFSPTKATWNGHNSSGWRSDLFSVNGFDERMKYGGEDRELGERLINYGIKTKQIRYSAICIHLDHERNYVDINSWKINNKIRSITRKEKKIWTNYGIERTD